MRYNMIGRNIEVTEGLKDAVAAKLGKLEKYFAADTKANIAFVVENEDQKVEITIPVKGTIFRSEQASSDMYASIDLAVEVIERQLKKYKTKITDAHRNSLNAFADSWIDEADEEDGDEIKIAKVKKFPVKPMDPEEACLQMELTGHNFFVFRNAETEEICVVYKRKNGSFGMIEPEE